MNSLGSIVDDAGTASQPDEPLLIGHTLPLRSARRVSTAAQPLATVGEESSLRRATIVDHKQEEAANVLGGQMMAIAIEPLSTGTQAKKMHRRLTGF